MTSIIGPVKDKNAPGIGVGLLQPDSPLTTEYPADGKTGRGVFKSIAQGKVPKKVAGSAIADLVPIADTLNPFQSSLPPQQNTANQLGSSSSNPLTIKVRSNLLSKAYRKND